MNRKGFANILLAVLAILIIGTAGYFAVWKYKPVATTDTSSSTRPGNDKTRTPILNPTYSDAQVNCKDISTLPIAAQQIISASRNEIETEGITESYFNAHFCLADSQDNKNMQYQRDIEWKYTIGDYSGTFNVGTPIKYQNLPAGYKVRQIMARAINDRDIISLAQATKILKDCMGPFSYAVSVYDFPNSKLYLQASPNVYPTGYTFVLGRVDVETGKCSIEKANPM